MVQKLLLFCRFFYVRNSCFHGGCARETFRGLPVPFPVRQPVYSCPPSLLIDTQVPLDVLHNAAVYRIRAVTQVMENLAFREGLQTDNIVLQDFALLCAIPLRDGCDLLDVISRRLQP